MDFDPFWLILFFFFVVAPLVERVLKGKSRPPPSRRPPGRQLPTDRRETGGRPPPDSLPEARPTARSDTDQAADMIPAELWEILTGQRRPGTQAPESSGPDVGTDATRADEPWRAPVPSRAEPPRRPAPEPSRAEPPRRPAPSGAKAVETAETKIRDEEAAAAELVRTRRVALERDRKVRHTPPVVVSLETEPLAEAQRHAAFHRTLDALPPPAGRERATPPIRARRFRGRDQLRSAILMQEILGPPKALDPD